jgi:hypothetical protein
MALQLTFAFFPLALTAAAFYWMQASGRSNRAERLLVLAASGGVMAFAYLVGTWAHTSIYLREVMLGVWVVAVTRSQWRRDRAAHGAPRRVGVSFVVLVTFTTLSGSALGARVGAAPGIDLRFPLAGGTYWIIQGGTSRVTNPFHVFSGTPAALDIVKLNAFGGRARSLAPRALSAYAIFGQPVLSPCSGRVVSGRDDLSDRPPGQPDTAHPSGNHVVLLCGDTEIRLGHFMQGSLAVAAGHTVERGQAIAKVGNSGHSLEPHLHIDARRGEMAIRMHFDGTTLTLNSRVSAPLARPRDVPDFGEWTPGLAPVVTPRARSSSAIHRAADADESGPSVEKARAPR